MNQQTTRPQTATEILKLAGNTLGERGKQYDPAGKQERSMTAIVAAFNAIYPRNPLTVHMGWQFMSLVKMVRGATKPHADSALDQVAYAALAAEEVAEQLHQPEPEPTAQPAEDSMIGGQTDYERWQGAEAALRSTRTSRDVWKRDYGTMHKKLVEVEAAHMELANQVHKERDIAAKFQAERKANVAMHEEVTRLRNKVQDLADLAEYRDKRNAELCAELETQQGKCIAQSSRISELQTLVDNLRSSLAQATKECESACADLARAQDEIRSLLAEKRHLNARITELEHGEGYEHQRKRIAQLESEATEARKRGSAGYNKQVAIQAEIQKELDTVRGQLLGLFDILWKFPHHLTIEQLWHKVRDHADKSSVAWGESSFMSASAAVGQPEAPCAHNTDEPKAPRQQYVDPYDSHGDMQPATRLVGDRDPARGGLAYPNGKP